MRRNAKILQVVVGALAVMVAGSFVPWFGARRSSGYHSDFPPAPYTFPKDFLFGAATAAHQVERGARSDWTAFENQVMAGRRFGSLGPGRAQPGHIHDLGKWPDDVRRDKTFHDTMFPEDFEHAAAMKHNAYRFSIEWARLFPNETDQRPDPGAINYYKSIFDELDRRHLFPSVTLFHFSSPAWLWEERGGKRGWERADALAHFERFVRAVADNFGGRASQFCTLNEPMVYLFNGYLEGIFPPNERRGDPAKITGVLSQLLKAHALAYKILKDDAQRRGRPIQVGYTQHARAFQPYRNWAPLDRVTAEVIEQAFIWDLVDAVKSGVLKVTNTGYREEIAGLAGTQDYLGINYYGRFYIKTDILHPTAFQVLPNDPDDKAEKKSDLGWAEYPRGFAEVLEKAHRKYRLPIYVLENGVADAADDDRDRQRYLVAHLRELWLARQRGADVRGYFHWSLLDNFEWAEGFEPRFGLMKVTYVPNYRRTPRPSAALYQRIIESGISADMVKDVGLPP